MSELRLPKYISPERRALLTTVLGGAAARHHPRAIVEALQRRGDADAMAVLGLLAQQGALLEAEQAGVPAGQREAAARTRLDALMVQDPQRQQAALGEYLRLAERGVVASRRKLGR